MIPKIIHYCWFGGQPKPEMALKCIESWKKYCPDYELFEWNESNFDLNYCDYVKEAFEAKKWAFITDVVRLYALYNCGGIYMDTDVEVIKPLDSLLKYEAVSGFESTNHIPTGLMASEKGQVMIKELLDEYDCLHFLKADGTCDLTTNVVRITNACNKYGFTPNNSLQTLNGFTFLPNDYLCPKDFDTKKIKITENTLCIHHFDGSWLSDEDKYRIKLTDKYRRILPKTFAARLAKFNAIRKYHGLKEALSATFKWLRKENKR